MALPVTSGLMLWFDASQITGLSNGSSLTTWTDQSGNANNATTGSGTVTYNTARINGLPAGTFSGAYISLASAIAASSGNTAFVVSKNAASGKGTFLGANTSGFAYSTGASSK